MLLVAAVVMGVGGLATVGLGTAALLDLGPFAPAEPLGLESPDALGDCREAGLDTGEGCDPGADVQSVRMWLSDSDTLTVELRLTEPPRIGASRAWTAEFYADTANAHTTDGVICRLSNAGLNADEAHGPGPEAVSYALDPNSVPRQRLPDAACVGLLDGASARFDVDVTGQPEETAFRLIGLVRVEHPDDPDHLGSDDDFLVRASVADLRD